MIVYIKDKKRNVYHPECSNCGARAVDTDSFLGKCPYGCEESDDFFYTKAPPKQLTRTR